MAASLLYLLLFLVLVFSLPAPTIGTGNWFIDCGASSSHVDVYGRTWVGDGGFVQSGVSYSPKNTSDWPTRYQTLRSFPQGKKNCYSIPVGEGTKIRVKADFLYANYDGLDKPPAFSMILETTEVVNIETDPSFESYVYIDFIYVTVNRNISICFGRTYPDQDPLVSALEIYTLDAGMYSKVNSSVILREFPNVVFGERNIRYPDDPYGRLWNPWDPSVQGYNYTTVLAGNATTVNTSTAVDKPPAIMFTSSATPPLGERNLTIRITSVEEETAYVNLYFSELSVLGPSQRRSFHVFLNDLLLTNATDPIVPPVGTVFELSFLGYVPTTPTIILVPSDNMTLPPMISGLETLRLRALVDSNGTKSSDVKALKILQERFVPLRNWSGDPCLPVGYNWDWLNCNSDSDPPRVTKLSLAGYGLSGFLPDFSDLDALISIDLHNNSLRGQIPDFLANLPDLRILNLANNNFSYIPPDLKNNKKISLITTGNPLLEPSTAPPPSNLENPGTPPPSNGIRETGTSIFLLYLVLLISTVCA